MQPKIQFHILGWITVLLFPALAFIALEYFEKVSYTTVLDKILSPYTLLGVEFGLFYGLIILSVSQFSIFQEMSSRQERLLKSLNLGWGDIIFMSVPTTPHQAHC